MATIFGEVMKLIDSEHWVHAVDAPVIVLLNGKPIAQATVDRFDRFEAEIPDDAHGEIEIRVGLNGAAPAMGFANGEDIYANVLYNPGGAYY